MHPTVLAANSGMEKHTRRLFIKDRNNRLNFLIDSGADLSVVPFTFYNSLHKDPNFYLSAANGSVINTYGIKLIDVDLGLRKTFKHNFILADVNRPIIGADFLAKFGLLVDLKGKQLIDSQTSLVVDAITIQSDTPTPKHFSVDNAYGDILREFPSLLAPANFNHPLKHNVIHHITTTGQLPFSRPRRLEKLKHNSAQLEFQHMQELGICKPSSSSVSSPLHMVQKSNSNDCGPCGDYGRLNNVTIPDRYPIPHIQDFTMNLNGCNIFSKIDLIRAYHNIPVADEDVHKTAITTPFGLFEFTRMPFGLRNAAQTFQRFMNEVVHGLSFIFVYIDDILVASKDERQHKEHLKILFQRLAEYGLTIKASKCVFGVTSLNFLSHTITSKGILPCKEKIDAISTFPSPNSVNKIQQFVGMINYYNRFIPSLSDMLTPVYSHLATLTKKNLNRRFLGQTSVNKLLLK